jgi:hypothetical protein
MSYKYNPIVRTFSKLRAELLNNLAIPRHDVRPDTPLAALLPAERRREIWMRLQRRGFPLPPLELPPEERRRNAIGVARAAVGLALSLQRLAGLLLAIPLTLVAYCASRPKAVLFPLGLRTVGEVVLYLTSFREHKSSGYRWTKNEISIKVRLIFAMNLGLHLTAVQPHHTMADLGVD